MTMIAMTAQARAVSASAAAWAVSTDVAGAVGIGGSVGFTPTMVGGPAGAGGTTARGVARGVGRGVGGGVGVGAARARGGNSPTMALGWMLRSWFRLPEPSSWSVRMCHGAPETSPAPSRTPPAARFQNLDWARWPPQARTTADPVDANLTTNSAVLFPPVEPAWTGPLIDAIVPPQIVNCRETPEYHSAPATDNPSVANPSDGNVAELAGGIDGHIDETPPPPDPQMGGETQPL
jgi:hypothetical protein